MKYDYLVVGSGLFGSTFAHEMHKAGKKVLVVDKRPHIGGNVYTKKINGINCDMYGPHIFHTNSKKIWDYVNQFADFQTYVPRAKVNYHGNIYSFPINLMTLSQLWGPISPDEAKERIESKRIHKDDVRNLEDWVLSQIGSELYEIFFEGYTTKQWGTHPSRLPASIARRIPIRFDYNDNYHSSSYQGIPIKGYTELVENMLENIEVHLDCDFFSIRDHWRKFAHRLVFTGMIDSYFDFEDGVLDYRSLRHETKCFNSSYQGNYQVNHTAVDVPFTRVIEHKFASQNPVQHSVVTWEYPDKYTRKNEPYYPIRDEKNLAICQKYIARAKKMSNVLFGGRLGSYQYMDMHQVVASALHLSVKEKGLDS